ncbi:MAG: hypothetical protein M4579_007413, partial [Chaenotheca gracillima]
MEHSFQLSDLDDALCNAFEEKLSQFDKGSLSGSAPRTCAPEFLAMLLQGYRIYTMRFLVKMVDLPPFRELGEVEDLEESSILPDLLSVLEDESCRLLDNPELLPSDDVAAAFCQTVEFFCDGFHKLVLEFQSFRKDMDELVKRENEEMAQ